MSEKVVLKGTRDGVAILVDPQQQFSDMLAELSKKLASSAEFWGGAKFLMGDIAMSASPEEKGLLELKLKEFGLILTEHNEARRKQPVPPKSPSGEADATVVRRTLRSGQRMEALGSVVVLGDVNPGAEVVAGGDILVLGSLRGVAHAGAQGRKDAVVMAFRLEPTQLRIAQFISRAPDETAAPNGPEIARVKNDRITVERYGG